MRLYIPLILVIFFIFGLQGNSRQASFFNKEVLRGVSERRNQLNKKLDVSTVNGILIHYYNPNFLGSTRREISQVEREFANYPDNPRMQRVVGEVYQRAMSSYDYTKELNRAYEEIESGKVENSQQVYDQYNQSYNKQVLTGYGGYGYTGQGGYNNENNSLTQNGGHLQDDGVYGAQVSKKIIPAGRGGVQW